MEKKKFLFIVSAFGILLVISGILMHPSLLSKISSGGSFRSDWTVAKIHLIRYYFILIGIIVLAGSLIINRVKQEIKAKYALIVLILSGICIVAAGLIFSPAFIENNFTSIKFIEDHNVSTLINIQLFTITFGFLVLLISLLLYRKKYWDLKRAYGRLITLIILILYLLTLNSTYLKLKYPGNVLAQPKEYGKLFDLLLGQDILLSDFDPQSTLVVKRQEIIKAKFPVIDINIHLSSSFQTEEDRDVLSPENLIKSMDSVGVRIIVNTDAKHREDGTLEEALNLYTKKYPDRFMNFYPSWFPPIIVSDDFLADLPNQLEKAVRLGVTGNGETWKDFGLRSRDITGKVIPVDDPRIDPLWEKAAQLNIPVLWHMGDPAPFFQPVNKYNERYIELGRYPEWSFHGPRFPKRETILKGRENVLKKHPYTIFIGCHMGWNSDDLEYAAYLLDTYPNYYLDLSTTLSELGRQPYTARKFFIKYQDRILFGTDGGSLFNVKGWTVAKFYRAYFEFLETENEYIDYPMQGAINQGSWKIYGINLPDEVLEKIYYKNAEKLLKIKIQP